jgi:Cu+-exporting ATPase
MHNDIRYNLIQFYNHVSIGVGADIAVESGDIVLIHDNLISVVSAIEISKKTITKIKQNLVYAFMYNIALVPVAAIGLLYPALAGIAMAATGN